MVNEWTADDLPTLRTAAMTPAEHRAAAEQALTDAWDDTTLHTLLRALTHAVLATTVETP